MKLPVLSIIFSLFYIFSLAKGEILKDWEKISPPELREFYDVLYNNGTFYIIGDKGTIISSKDGINWAKIHSGGKGFIGITYGKGRYVAVGEKGNIKISTDGKNWQNVELDVGKTLMDVAYGNGIFVAVGELGTILYSEDGIIWKKADSIPEETFFGIKNILGTFYATGTDATLLKSIDGKNWEKIDVGLKNPKHFGSIAYGKDKWIICGSAGRVFISSDMKTWEEKIIVPERYGSQRLLIDIIFAFNHFIITGQYGIIATSEDGENWDILQTEGRNFLMRIERSEDSLIAVGLGGAIFKSTKDSVQEKEEPVLKISGSYIDFGALKLDESITRSVTVNNIGNKELIIYKIEISGSSDFTQTNNCTELGPYESCSIDISFSPTSEGKKNAVIYIKSNDINNPTVAISVTGIGTRNTEPQIDISKTKIEFDKTYVGSTSSKKVILSNKGYTRLEITDIYVDKSQFIFTRNCKTIDPLDSCILTISFKPDFEGTIQGTLTIKSNDPENPVLKINLTGEGISSKKTPYLTKTSVYFEEIPINTSKKEEIYVINKGERAFTNLKIELHQDENIFSQINTCDGISLRKGEECKIEITFSPTEAGNFEGELVINYNSNTGFFSSRGEYISVKLKGSSYQIIDSSFISDTEITVENGAFINPPEQIKKPKLPDRYQTVNNISFKYEIGIIKDYSQIRLIFDLPVEFDAQSMEAFLCTKKECKNITPYITLDSYDKKIISLIITDGGELDLDNLRNHQIKSSIVIAKLSTAQNTENKTSSSKGGGCSFAQTNNLVWMLFMILYLTGKVLRRGL